MPECDALLYHAYSIYKASIHEPCGQWAAESFDEANADSYEVVEGESTCYACAVLDRWRKDATDRSAEPGAMVYLRHVRDAHGGTGLSQADLVAAYAN